MKFIKKADKFFYRTQFSITLNPEPVFNIEGKRVSLLLKPDDFFNIIIPFGLKYPFIVEEEILELKLAMRNDGLTSSEAIDICERFKNKYWLLNLPLIPKEVTDLLRKKLKILFPKKSDKALLLMELEYQNIIENKMHKVYKQLMSQFQDEKPEFINNFDEVPPSDVYRFFNKELLVKGIINKNDLIEYLKYAFEYGLVPPERYKLERISTKGKIGDIFYRYYKDLARAGNGKKNEYIRLMTDYFVGFSEEEGGRSQFRRKY
jgi:hypothetical protein